MTFLLIAACMVAAAALALALPLWRGRAVAAAGTATANRQVHAARLAELEADLDAGRLSAEDHAAAQRDLERDLMAGLTEARGSATAKPQPAWAAIAAIFVIALGSGLYWGYGNWRAGSEGVAAASQQAVIDMVERLAERLHTPQGHADLQGWIMLGHSYMIMGRYPDALGAFENARRLSGDQDPQILASYAEALSISDPDQFSSKAAPLFEKVLLMDPNNTQALWYGGLGALQRGDSKLAIRRWNALLAQNPPADYRAYIEKAIVGAGGRVAEANPGASISVHVSLAAAVMAKVSPDDTVFVYAQPTGTQFGPPLAAKRLQVRDLPVDLELSDRDAVVPGRMISAYGAVTVFARVSKSGTATARAGDLIGQHDWKRGDGGSLAVVIDTTFK